MRISPSPTEIRNKFTPKTYQTPLLLENPRSNSLSNSALYPAKFPSRIQSPYASPYYHQNSAIFVSSQHDLGHEPKTISKTIGNFQNTHVLQNTIKTLTERVQIIEKLLKTHENPLKFNTKLQDQKHLADFINQKISHQIQKKHFSQYELLFHQIKELQNQIAQNSEHHSSNEYGLLGTSSYVESGKHKVNDQESVLSQKKNMKVMEEKIKDEIFKLQIHLENQMNKAIKSIRPVNDQENTNGSGFSSGIKSKLKYKYRPVQIVVKNEVKVNSQDTTKKRKEHLSTAHSTGSSEEYETKNEAKVLDLEEFSYFIDKEGYLLDESGYYLLDEKDKMIKVDRKLIKRLREFNMIE